MSIDDKIREQIEGNDVLLYMKGTPDFPQCGFSAQTAQILKQYGVEFSFVNILEDQELRERLKEYANWPTYPQLWIQGELVGGCDLVMEMDQSGELREMVEQATGKA